MTRPKMIRLDRSACNVVVVCEGCPHWRAFAFTVEKAYISGADHEERVHPNDYRFRDAQKTWAARHAARTSKV